MSYFYKVTKARSHFLFDIQPSAPKHSQIFVIKRKQVSTKSDAELAKVAVAAAAGIAEYGARIPTQTCQPNALLSLRVEDLCKMIVAKPTSHTESGISTKDSIQMGKERRLKRRSSLEDFRTLLDNHEIEFPKIFKSCIDDFGGRGEIFIMPTIKEETEDELKSE